MANWQSQYRIFIETDTSVGDATVGDDATCSTATAATSPDSNNNGASGLRLPGGVVAVLSSALLGALVVL